MANLNDPRVFFAAERTLLAWNRTSISLMAFGFVVERFGLFLELVAKEETSQFQRHLAFFIGESSILLAAFMSVYSILQHTRILRTLSSIDIPEGYNLWASVAANAAIGGLGLALSAYLAMGFS